jgi:hypothetical protein
MLRRTKALAGSAARTAGRTAIIAGTAGAVLGRGQGQAAPPAAAPAPAASHAPPAIAATDDAGDHLIAQIERLAALKTAGVLSDEEFAAAKKKLLA